jgi:hypothetical protein
MYSIVMYMYIPCQTDFCLEMIQCDSSSPCPRRVRLDPFRVGFLRDDITLPSNTARSGGLLLDRIGLPARRTSRCHQAWDLPYRDKARPDAVAVLEQKYSRNAASR